MRVRSPAPAHGAPPAPQSAAFDGLCRALAKGFGAEAANWVLLASVRSTNALGRRLAQEYLKEGSRVPHFELEPALVPF